MKRYISLALCLLLMLTAAFSVSASETELTEEQLSQLLGSQSVTISQTYTVNEMGGTIDLPTNWVVLEANKTYTDEQLAALDFTQETFKNYMTMLSAHMIALNTEKQITLTVSSVEDESSRSYKDFNNFEDTLLETIAVSLAETISSDDMPAGYTGIYEHKQARFVVIDSYSDTTNYFIRSMRTCVNSRFVVLTFSFADYNDEIGSEYLSIVDSVNFSGVAEREISASDLSGSNIVGGQVNSVSTDSTTRKQLSSGTITMIVFCSILGVIFIAGTIIILVTPEEKKGGKNNSGSKSGKKSSGKKKKKK